MTTRFGNIADHEFKGVVSYFLRRNDKSERNSLWRLDDFFVFFFVFLKEGLNDALPVERDIRITPSDRRYVPNAISFLPLFSFLGEMLP